MMGIGNIVIRLIEGQLGQLKAVIREMEIMADCADMSLTYYPLGSLPLSLFFSLSLCLAVIWRSLIYSVMNLDILKVCVPSTELSSLKITSFP